MNWLMRDQLQALRLRISPEISKEHAEISHQLVDQAEASIEAKEILSGGYEQGSNGQVIDRAKAQAWLAKHGVKSNAKT